MVDISWMVTLVSVITSVVIWTIIIRRKEHGFWSRFLIWSTLVMGVLAMILGQKLDHLLLVILMAICLVMLEVIERKLKPRLQQLREENRDADA